MGALEDFLSTSYELPADLQAIGQNIYDQVTAYLEKNLPQLTRPDPADPANMIPSLTE
jgi:hypothetical protein